MAEPATIASVQADYVDAGGARLFVRRWQGADTQSVLYWHGGGGGSTEYPEIAPALTERGYSVYAPDGPGYGTSPPLEPEEYRASNVAAIAIALVEALGISPTIWIGFSWGASIGIHVAARHPEHIKALVLLDGGYFVPEDDPDYDPSLDLEARTAALEAELDPADSWDAPVEIMAAVVKGSNDEPAPPLLPAVEATGLPVLLVAASRPPEHEAVRALALGRFRAALPSAEAVSVEARHGVLQEAGRAVRGIVLDWLDRKG
jgi:pimeloyl-ACP methyl ester carboxylesterase